MPEPDATLMGYLLQLEFDGLGQVNEVSKTTRKKVREDGRGHLLFASPFVEGAEAADLERAKQELYRGGGCKS